MTVGERIKDLRLKSGISQVELADKMNVSKQTLYKYENNIITNIPSDKIEVVAKLFKVSPSYLMGWDNKDPFYNVTTRGYMLKFNSPSEQAIIELYNSLNNVGKEEAYKRLEELSLIEKYTTKEKYVSKKETSHVRAAHARKDIIRNYQAEEHDQSIMDDDSEWE